MVDVTRAQRLQVTFVPGRDGRPTVVAQHSSTEVDTFVLLCYATTAVHCSHALSAWSGPANVPIKVKDTVGHVLRLVSWTLCCGVMQCHHDADAVVHIMMDR